MTKVKRSRGRPVEKPLPPRTDATMDQLADAMFALPADYEWQYDKTTKHLCAAWKRPVSYPDNLTRAGLCGECCN